MEKEMIEQFQLLFSAIEDVRAEIKDSENRTQIYIENQVSKRIDSLFDGYKLTHEKQWELERETEALKAKTDELQARIAALENKIA